ncbi:MAG TPA: hypothetical protein VIU40_02725 [Geobacteraceae bacterium]
MNLTTHAKATGVAALCLLPVWGAAQLLCFAVGSILIDVDHYIFYVFRRRRFDVRGMFAYFEDLQEVQHRIPYAGICIFHTVEFYLLVYLLSLRYSLFTPVFIGMLYHFVLDLIHLRRHRFLTGRAFFILEHFVRVRRYQGYPFF